MNQNFNHLWQSTIFAAAVALVCTALRRNSPRLRYWLWLATSMKFLLPFSLLVSTGARIQLPPDTPSLPAGTVQQISTYFTPVASAPARTSVQWPLVLGAIWLTGSLSLLARWFRNWRKVELAAKQGRLLEPGVFGIFRPVLFLPEGIADRLSPGQYDAVLVHELRHIRYRDNLTAAVHMCVEAIFWFHPIVWWIGAKLDGGAGTRLRRGRPRTRQPAWRIRQRNRPGLRSIHRVTAGVRVGNQRVGSEEAHSGNHDMARFPSRDSRCESNARRRQPDGCVDSVRHRKYVRAQTLPPDPAYGYEVASIHKSEPGPSPTGYGAFAVGPQGGLRTIKTSVVELVTFAYNVQDYQLIGMPGWASSEHYDVTLTPDEAESGPSPDLRVAIAGESRNRQRLRAVLNDRFGLVLRAETRRNADPYTSDPGEKRR